jgi:D-glycero-D-manno-heptose 1,7-bisphosphate phosphatase
MADPTACNPPGRAVFWDRDGTLMHEEHYCSDPSAVRAMPGLGTALAALRRAGWLNVMITNQSGIGGGRLTKADFEAVNRELCRQLDFGFDGIYFCADTPAAATDRRKPGIGMIREAVADLGISTAESWMVGDKDSDILCGRSAGCRTILVQTGYGRSHTDARPDHICPDATAAAELILAACRT